VSTDPDRVSERQRHSKRKSLGHCDHEHGDTDDKELDKLSDVLGRPRQMTYRESRHAEPQQKDYHSRYCYRRAYNVATTSLLQSPHRHNSLLLITCMILDSGFGKRQKALKHIKLAQRHKPHAAAVLFVSSLKAAG